MSIATVGVVVGVLSAVLAGAPAFAADQTGKPPVNDVVPASTVPTAPAFQMPPLSGTVVNASVPVPFTLPPLSGVVVNVSIPVPFTMSPLTGSVVKAR